jgi:hypothetical protein
MICHKTKCIFIHIPRTGGTSIEVSIQGRDQWGIESTEKHLIASTAKKIYADFWNEYFKFSFVRNPWSRMVSTCKYGDDHPKEKYRTYGCSLKNNKFSLGSYLERFPTNREIDPRSKSANEIFGEPINNSVYMNILNEKLDFIGKLENINHDMEYVSHKIGKKLQLKNREKSKRKSKKDYKYYYTEETIQQIQNLYDFDIKKFGYEFNEPSNKWIETKL